MVHSYHYFSNVFDHCGPSPRLHNLGQIVLEGGLWHSLGLNRFTTVLILDGTLVVHVVNALKLTKPLHRHNILRVSYRGLYSASPTLLTRPRQVCC